MDENQRKLEFHLITIFSPPGSCELPNKHSNFIVEKPKRHHVIQVFKVHVICNRITKYQVPSNKMQLRWTQY